MAFTSLMFIFLFLPIVIISFYLVRGQARKYILLLASLFFYACGSPTYLILLLISVIINIAIGALIQRAKTQQSKRIILIAGLAYDVGLLFYYKYFDFLVRIIDSIFDINILERNLILPLGLSFFTFKAISYVVDIYKGKIENKNSFVNGAVYMTFFPQISSGPLARYENMGDIGSDRKGVYANLSNGIWRFLVGLCKKVIIANSLAPIATEVFAATEISTTLAWLGSLTYTLQLFFDFSGYSDMAIGIGEMLGIRCPENFNYPYFTPSITEFWRRWHITLGAWFRDYVYIPLGGSRVKRSRVFLNLFVVWFLTGLWHGASWNFIVWGLAYFVLIVAEKVTGYPQKIKSSILKLIYRVGTFLMINFLWVFFNAEDLRAGLDYIGNMFGATSNPLADMRAWFLLKDNLAFFIIGILLCFPILPTLRNKVKHSRAGAIIWDVGETLVVVFGAFWAVSLIVAGQNNPFLYANF